MIRHGSKPSREIINSPPLLAPILNQLQSFDEAVGYAPNQVFIGNLPPDALRSAQGPWYLNRMEKASRWGAFGEIMPEEEFLGILKICDEFDLIRFSANFTRDITARLETHPLIHPEDFNRLKLTQSSSDIQNMINDNGALPLYIQRDTLIGCVQRGHDEDPNLTPEILLENIAARASGVMALRGLIDKYSEGQELDYLLGCGEEAVGDRYNRGGGNLAKAIGELCDCSRATGSDVKAFCCAPLHAMVLAAGLIAANVSGNVAVVGGGSVSKLGMKFQGHLQHNMPILEDALAGIAILVGQDDGMSPIIRLDSIGKHEIVSGSSQQAILAKLVTEPLDRLGMKITDIDSYATEMHNPELTEPQGSGDVPLTNYRSIGSFAVLRGEISRDQIDDFVDSHGMPGFSPTQGHIASAIPVLGHALKGMMENRIKTTMFLAKGSLFLGRMTQLADGLSFLLEKNPAQE